MAFVYILKSLVCDRFYVGSTVNLDRRLKEHQAGRVLSTKPILPVVLVFSQECSNYSQAMALEKRIKRFKRKDIIEKIVREGKMTAPVAQMDRARLS